MIYLTDDMNALREAAEIGKKYRECEFDQITEAEILDEIVFSELGENAFRIAKASAMGNDISFEVKEWIRIGEPAICYKEKCYYPSYNYAEGRTELGVSVVTREWLDSISAEFYGLDNATLRGRGLWRICGFEIARGGDGEPLIYPVNWAERLKVYSRAALEKLV